MKIISRCSGGHSNESTVIFGRLFELYIHTQHHFQMNGHLSLGDHLKLISRPHKELDATQL